MLDRLITLYANMGNSRGLPAMENSVIEVSKDDGRELHPLATRRDFDGLRKCYEEWQSSSCNHDERGMLILWNASTGG